MSSYYNSFLFLINEILTNGYNHNVLEILSVLAILSGISVIISKNPVVSVLYLIALFAAVSSYLIIIGLNFIGLSYLIVYIGAVSILFLFILMLINIRVSELISDTNNNIPLAILTILGFFIPYNKLLPDTKIAYNLDIFNKDKSLYIVSSNNWDSNLLDTYDIINIGNVMYTNLSMWLIITSIILLLAMVGSIIITVKQKY